VHYDPGVAARAKLPAPLVDGQMLGALLAEHALDAFGGRGRVVRMSFRFRSPVVAGETVRCVGTVERRDGDRVTLAQQVLVGDRVAVAPATTELEL
jgi:acyl dehydratase